MVFVCRRDLELGSTPRPVQLRSRPLILLKRMHKVRIGDLSKHYRGTLVRSKFRWHKVPLGVRGSDSGSARTNLGRDSLPSHLKGRQ